jgi:hypothetical protein
MSGYFIESSPGIQLSKDVTEPMMHKEDSDDDFLGSAPDSARTPRLRQAPEPYDVGVDYLDAIDHSFTAPKEDGDN